MNIDLHSHFFPVEALQNPGKYQERAPKIVLDKGKLKVTSQIGIRPGLDAGAYDAWGASRRWTRCELISRRFRRRRSCYFTGKSRRWRPTFRASKTKQFKRSSKSIQIVSSVSERAATKRLRGHCHCRGGKKYGLERVGDRQCRGEQAAA